MNTISAGEIKRRGMSAVDEAAKQGPVHVVKGNQARYVVMTEEDYEQMIGDLAAVRLAASEDDLQAGRVRRGTASQLLREIRRGK